MSFAVRRLGVDSAASGGSGGIVYPLSPMNLTCRGLAGSSHSGQINFNTDGTISRSVTSPDTSHILSNWFTTTVGTSAYYVSFTLSSGDAWDAGLTSGTLYQLSSQRSLKWSATSGNQKLATTAVAIYSTSSGSTTGGSAGTLNTDIESNN